MLKYFFGSIILGLAGLALYLYIYLGVSLPVEISVEKRGPLLLLWQEHIGPYHQIMPVIQKAEGWALANNVPCTQTFGEFLDNPEAVDQDRLRSRVGCILSAPLGIQVPTDFQFESRPERTYAIGRFKGSPAIGPMTVYPAMAKYIEEKRLKTAGPPLEIYTVNGQQVSTEYLFPVDEPETAPATN